MVYSAYKVVKVVVMIDHTIVVVPESSVHVCSSVKTLVVVVVKVVG